MIFVVTSRKLVFRIDNQAMDGPVYYALYGILKMCINFTKGDVLSFFLRRENFLKKKNLYSKAESRLWNKINDRKKIDRWLWYLVKNCFHIRECGARSKTILEKINKKGKKSILIIREKIRIEHAAKLKALKKWTIGGKNRYSRWLVFRVFMVCEKFIFNARQNQKQ